MLVARNAQALEEVATEIKAVDSHIETLIVPTDTSDEAEVDSLFQKVVARFGRADVLVNNSGVGGTPGFIRDADPKVWWEAIVSSHAI